MKESVGSVLRRLRERSNLSQAQLAKLAGVRQTDISRLETGQRGNVRFELVARLAAALSLSLDDVAYAAGIIPKPPSSAAGSKRLADARYALEEAMEKATSLQEHLTTMHAALVRRPKRRR